MEKFWELVEESVIFQGILVVLVAGTYCGLMLLGRPVPEGLDRLVYVIVGFFFGGKGMVTTARVAKGVVKSGGAKKR